MKILLNPTTEAKFETHPDTGATFKIRPITPTKYEDIRRKSLRSDGTTDLAKWGGNFAVAAIEDWEGVGEGNDTAECNDANRKIFGERQAINIMPWIIDRATSLDQYRVEEEEAAKND